jgi:hypothetical protein
MEKVKNKLVFTTKDGDKTVELAVKKPDVEQTKELQKFWNAAFQEALTSGAMLRSKLRDEARRQGLWSQKSEDELNKLQKEIFDIELKLSKGGAAGLTKNGGKALALRVKEIRAEIRELTAGINDLELRSAESQADNERFSRAVALCTFDPKTGDKFFKSYEDFKSKEDTQAAFDASRNLAFLTNGLDPNFEAELFENKFLKEYGFVDEKLRLINKDGKLVDSKGRLIREDGRFVNEKNELIDADGNPVDEKGNYKVEFKPFLDDEE